MLPIGIYARISRDTEGQGLGVERQLDDCRKLALAHGYQVVSEYVDNDLSAFSGKKRPEYLRLCDDLKRRVIKGVVIWHPDRLHRSPRELEDFITLIEATQAQVQTVTAGAYDLTTPSGRMSARIVGAVARQESEHKSERIKRKKQQMADNGDWAGGNCPFGYGNRGVIIEEQAEAIRQAIKDVLSGTSMRAIARRWNEAGLTTPYGKQWRGATVKQTLTQPVLAGMRVHHGQVVGKGNWKAIVDPKTWERLVAFCSNPDRNTTGTIRARRRLLGGMLICGKCKSPLSSAILNKHREGVPGVKAYQCCLETGCHALSISSDPVDDLVRDFAIKAICESKAVAKALGNQDEVEMAHQAVSDIRTRIAELQEAHFVEASIDKESYRKLQKTLDKKLASASANLATVARSGILEGLPTDPEKLLDLWNHESLEWKRSLIEATCESITILPVIRRGQNKFNPDRVQIVPRQL